MIELAYPIAVVAISAITAYCFLQWLAAFKRRNDLMDRFQAFERAQAVAVDQMRIQLDQLDGVRQRFDNLVPNHEKLVARVNAVEEYTKSEITKLGGEVLGAAQEFKTQMAAQYQQGQRMQLPGRVFKP